MNSALQCLSHTLPLVKYFTGDMYTQHINRCSLYILFYIIVSVAFSLPLFPHNRSHVFQCFYELTNHIEYYKQLTNQLDYYSESSKGSKGAITSEFAFLLKFLWAGYYKYIVPRDFKVNSLVSGL